MKESNTQDMIGSADIRMNQGSEPIQGHVAGDHLINKSPNNGRRSGSDHKNMKKLEDFWRQKQKAACNLEI